MNAEIAPSSSAALRLPAELPILPLSGVLLLPRGRMPLNIYELRYIAMIDEAMANGRMLGVIQPSIEDDRLQTPPLYRVGCAGKITSFTESDDGRYLINLSGLCRFEVGEELPQGERPYRRIVPNWAPFKEDLEESDNADYDRARLTEALRNYFRIQGVMADWNVVQNTASEELVSSLAMICPLPPNEKQALLEAPSLHARADLLITLLEMASLNQDDGETARH